jgi:hypothetical protein
MEARSCELGELRLLVRHLPSTPIATALSQHGNIIFGRLPDNHSRLRSEKSLFRMSPADDSYYQQHPTGDRAGKEKVDKEDTNLPVDLKEENL